MSRSDSVAGLSERARALVEEAEVVAMRSHQGLCDAFGLADYRLPDGRRVHETIQADVWAGGPTWFMTLADDSSEHVPGMDWTDQEIADHMGEEYGEAVPSITPDDEAMFVNHREALESGQVKLSWSSMEKFDRWLQMQKIPGAQPTVVQP